VFFEIKKKIILKWKKKIFFKEKFQISFIAICVFEGGRGGWDSIAANRYIIESEKMNE
jgi:hypothetical protein